jgi:RNase adaptor protein for sRNA GlmZ degradation
MFQVAMADVRRGTIVSLLDEIETHINDHVGQATALVDEAEQIGGLLRHSQVHKERLEHLLSQTARLRRSIERQRAILAELRARMRVLRPRSS